MQTPNFTVDVNGNTLGPRTNDLEEAELYYRALLSLVWHGALGLHVVELRISTHNDEWHTVREGWSYKGDRLWFMWEGGRVIHIHTGDSVLPAASLEFEPTVDLTEEEFIAACVLYETENQDLVDRWCSAWRRVSGSGGRTL